MADLKDFCTHVLKDIQWDALEDVLKKIGVASLDHFSYIQWDSDYDDFKGVLNKIQYRILAREVNKLQEENRSVESNHSERSVEFQATSTPRRPLAPRCIAPSVDFQVPLDKFNARTRQRLEKGEAVSDDARKLVLRTTCYEILEQCPNATGSFITDIAKNMVRELPGLGDLKGDGHFTILRKMGNIIQGLRREEKVKSSSVPFIKKRGEGFVQISPQHKYGCLNFLPETYGDGETAETQLKKAEHLQQIFERGPSADDYDEAEVDSLMQATYPSQRFQMVEAIQIQKKPDDYLRLWPFLSEFKYVKLHFRLLTGTDMDARIAMNLKGVTKDLTSYFKAESAKPRKKVMTLTQRKIRDWCSQFKSKAPVITEASDEPGNDPLAKRSLENKFVLALAMAGLFMRDDLKSLFYFIPVSKQPANKNLTCAEVSQIVAEHPDDSPIAVEAEGEAEQADDVDSVEPEDMTQTQYEDDGAVKRKSRIRLVIVGSNIYSAVRSYPMIDDVCIGEGLSLFDGLVATFALHYVFARPYPFKAKGMMDLLQRKIFQLEGTGSKVERVNNHRQPAPISSNYITFKDRVKTHCLSLTPPHEF